MSASFHASITHRGTVTATHSGPLTPYSVELLADMARHCNGGDVLRVVLRDCMNTGDEAAALTLFDRLRADGCCLEVIATPPIAS
jgi:hypothetical protein